MERLSEWVGESHPFPQAPSSAVPLFSQAVKTRHHMWPQTDDTQIQTYMSTDTFHKGTNRTVEINPWPEVHIRVLSLILLHATCSSQMARLSLTNKPTLWEKEGEPAEGGIIKYTCYSTMFHSAQMSHSMFWDCCEAPVSECVHNHPHTQLNFG